MHMVKPPDNYASGNYSFGTKTLEPAIACDRGIGALREGSV